MSDFKYVTPLKSLADDDIIFDLNDWLEPEAMEFHDDSPIVADDQEQRPLPDNSNLDFKAGGSVTNFLAQNNDQLAKIHAFQQMDAPNSTYQVNEETTLVASTENEIAQYDDTTPEIYDLMRKISGSAAIGAASNEFLGYTPVVAPSSHQQQQREQLVPGSSDFNDMNLEAIFDYNRTHAISEEWTGNSNNDSQQARVEADDGPENLASQALNTDWSAARQSYEQYLQYQPPLLYQHEIFHQPPQQPAPQQPDATAQQGNKRKRKADKPASSTRAPKKGKVAIERIVTNIENGNLEVVISDVTPEYAAAVEKNEQNLNKKVRNLKRLGLCKGLKAEKYKKRCRGEHCNQYETDCHCPGGFVN